MYKEPVTTDAAAATLSAAKCHYCAACYVCLASPTPDIEIAAITGIWGIDGSPSID